jgi:hypothetical protein
MEGVLTVEPSPKIAAQLAKDIYGVQNEFLLGFFKKSYFQQFPSSETIL